MKRAFLLVVLGLMGCSNASPATTDAGPGSDTGTPHDAGSSGGPVTYYGDVRPILASHCLGCHVAGGIAPITLDTYTAAMSAAPLIVTYTQERRMPPFLADNSGACQHFQTNDWLSDAELQTLSDWTAQGTPEGDPSTPPPTVHAVQHLSGAGVTNIDIGVDYSPNASLTDDYHCFVVQAPSGGYLTGAEVHPGNARIVHHVIVYEPTSASDVSTAMANDAAEPGPGYTCFGGPGAGNATPVVLWAPGAGAAETPTGTGLQIDGTRPLIIQVHYNLLSAQPGDTDHSTVDVRIVPSAIPAFFIPLWDADFDAPPHMASYTHHADYPFGSFWLGMAGVSSAHVYAIGPHMHTLGRDVQVDMINPDGSTDCMVHIPRWDFNWQLGYRYQTPIPIDTTTQMRITCTWDTSSRDTAVTWGEGTQDEMCLAFLYVSI